MTRFICAVLSAANVVCATSPAATEIDAFGTHFLWCFAVFFGLLALMRKEVCDGLGE